MDTYPQGTPLSEIEFRPGDLFVVEGKATISGLIRYFTKGRASHAGLITTVMGDTIESLGKIRQAHIRDYLGQRVVIVRPDATNDKKVKAIAMVEEKWLGKRYPWWRFVPHVISQVLPFAGKINLIGIPVCSELVAFAEHKMGIRDGNEIWGKNPDDLMDTWVLSPKKYEFVYRGRLVK